MEAQDKLAEAMAYVAAARTLPMSSSAVVNKAELTRLLEELRDLLPKELREAATVLGQRDTVLAEATANAERLLEAAAEEQRRLVSDHEVLREARVEAGELVRVAREKSEQMTRDVDGYVDAKLAHLEVSVTTILDTIRDGRERLAQSTGLYDELASPDEPPAG